MTAPPRGQKSPTPLKRVQCLWHERPGRDKASVMPLIQATNELAVRILNAQGGFSIHAPRHIRGISSAGLLCYLPAIVLLIFEEGVKTHGGVSRHATNVGFSAENKTC